MVRGCAQLTVALPALALFGCTGTPTYEEARLVCGLQAGDHHFVDSELVGVDGDPLPSRCVRTLGRGIGMDWSSFDARPSDLASQTSAGWTILGLYFLVASDFGGQDAVLPPPDTPGWVWDALAQAPDPATSSEDPVGRLLYDTLTDAIEHTVLGDIGESDARVSGSGSKLTISADDPELRGGYEAAGILVHEAAHVRRGGHVSCDGEACDADAEGSYGLEVFTLWTWMAGLDHSVTREHDACEDASRSVREHCALILDPSQLSACDSDADPGC